ncbi:MAG: UTP--glucose-1-phosphate uridylyltransferase [Deltaproteobacteria bacterium]|nr:UTP--glucose-1-phosphate uridylyltransferase [Deltaproteobacteria bacterium]
MTTTLQQELEALDPGLLAHLRVRGFRREQLLAWAATLAEDTDRTNRLPGSVAAVPEEQLGRLPPAPSAQHARLTALGREALVRGELAVCVLAGGMATRMGGVVKALVEVVPGLSFLDMQLGELRQLAELYGAAPPLWLMTSEATDAPVRAALGARCDGSAIAAFEQFVSLRLAPEGALLRDGNGAPSSYPTGHGDLPEALRASGLLDRFRAGGGRYVWVSNLDNLGACVDALVLGWHIDRGAALTVELVDKHPGDAGGGPVMYRGRPMIVEHFRLPREFDPEQVPVFNTNTFLVDAGALAELRMPWTYVRVDKKVGGRVAVQFERLLGELTAGIEPRLLRVSREGLASRFLPVKDQAALEKLRPVFVAMAESRGLTRPGR